ncbi:MAG: alanine--tRNA ligase-related protein [Acidilobaceae archaeon]
MKTRLLFQEDSYLREFTARVLESSGSHVILDATAFHPTPYGGLDTDTGYLESGGVRVKVLRAEVRGDLVAHIVEPPAPFTPGSEVRGVIDWDKRYNMMRLHTAAHIIASVMYRRYGALITGGHITPEYSRDDFDITVEDWKKAFEEAIAESNEIIGRCVEVKIYWLPREEALKIEGMVKLAEKLPPEVEKLRIVEITGVDIQADGGPHVRSTCEIGEVKLLKIENRGKRKKRIYYTLRELADKVKI